MQGSPRLRLVTEEQATVLPRALREYQETAIERLRESLRTGHKRPVVQAPTGAGKCLGIGTLVMMADGGVRSVEQVRAGEALMGPDGRPRLVLSTTQGIGPLYRIVPVKGEPWVCNDVHMLTLVETESGRIVDVPLNEYLTKTKWFRHLHKQFQPEYGIDFPENDDPIIPGYFLGIWVGDGTKALNGVQVSKPDQEIADECGMVAAAWGGTVTMSGPPQRCPSYSIVTPRGQPNPLLQEMRRLVGDGSIPHSVRTASRHYRQQFLAGVFDTDGYNTNGCCEIAQKSVPLAEGIAFIARSLGIKVTVSQKVVNRETYQRMSLSGDLSEIPTRIHRKTFAPRQQKKRATRTGFSVEPIGVGRYAGFELDDDGRFLLGDFTVTHNTLVAANIIRMALAKGKRVVFCCPALSLIDQTIDAFAAESIWDVGVIQASHQSTDWSRPVQIASVQTLMRRWPAAPEADLVIVDECHALFAHYGVWMTHPDWMKVPFIGLSATPWTKGLGRLYDDLILLASTRELIDQGYLSKFQVFSPGHPDLSKVRTVAGEYHEGDLSGAMNTAPLVADVVQTWIDRANYQPTLCFAVDRAHAKHLQQQFLAAGVPCGYQDMATTPLERREIREKFHTGEYKVVTNCDTLTVGVDWDVRCISMVRPTKSIIKFVQIIGRGLRTAPGKNSLTILDHSDNHLRLGFVTDIHRDKLDDGRAAVKQERQIPLPRECPQCHYLRPPRTNECPNCGFKHEPKTVLPEVKKGELVELKDSKLKRKRQKLKMMDIHGRMIPLGDFYGELMAYARETGRKDGWAAHRFRDAIGVWPNSYRDTPERTPSMETRAWIRAMQIKWAKGRGARV